MHLSYLTNTDIHTEKIFQIILRWFTISSDKCFPYSCISIFFWKIETIFHGIKHIPNVDILVYGSPYRRVFYVLTGMNLATIFTRLKNDNIKISKKIANVMEIVLSSLVLAYFFMRNSLPNTQFYYKYLIDLFLCACFILIFSFDEGCISNYLKKPMMQKLGNMAIYFLNSLSYKDILFLVHRQVFRLDWININPIYNLYSCYDICSFFPFQ